MIRANIEFQTSITNGYVLIRVDKDVPHFAGKVHIGNGVYDYDCGYDTSRVISVKSPQLFQANSLAFEN